MWDLRDKAACDYRTISLAQRGLARAESCIDRCVVVKRLPANPKLAC